jgi:hypothetical protein
MTEKQFDPDWIVRKFFQIYKTSYWEILTENPG